MQRRSASHAHAAAAAATAPSRLFIHPSRPLRGLEKEGPDPKTEKEKFDQ